MIKKALLYDDHNKRYDVITNSKQLLACRAFCVDCMKSFTNYDSYKNHTRDECIKTKLKKR